MQANDLFYAYLPEYLDGEISPDVAAKLQGIADKERVMSKYQEARGRLQLLVQGYFLNEGQQVRLHDFVEAPTARYTREVQEIEKVGRWELFSSIQRRFIIAVIVLAVVIPIIYYFMPKQVEVFNPLENIGYEALAMEEDSEGRLDFPSDNIREIADYFSTYPGLKFQTKIFMNMADWMIEGATVVDYDVAKVAVVQYKTDRLNEKMFHFMYAGDLTDLPKSDPGNYQGFVYQTYASDQLNMIAWQQSPGVVAMLVGHRSAPELASLAKTNQ